MLLVDAFGVAVFRNVWARTAYEAEVLYLIVVVMGTITGFAGGIMRDVRRKVYTTASVAVVFVFLQETGAGDPLTTLLPIATTFTLLLAATRLDLQVPPFRPKDG